MQNIDLLFGVFSSSIYIFLKLIIRFSINKLVQDDYRKPISIWPTLYWTNFDLLLVSLLLISSYDFTIKQTSKTTVNIIYTSLIFIMIIVLLLYGFLMKNHEKKNKFTPVNSFTQLSLYMLSSAISFSTYSIITYTLINNGYK